MPEPLTQHDFQRMGQELSDLLTLRYSPIALKLIYDESEIPDGSMRPYRDKNGHLAMCQAFAMVRRERKSITMLRDDHWCVWPLVSSGLVELTDEDMDYMGRMLFFSDAEKGVEFLRSGYPRLESERQPVGFTLAPLEKTDFVPDVISVYCRPAQVRSILMAVRYETGEQLRLSLDSVDSCVHSTIPVLNGQDFNLTVPDPGEYERALTDEDELIFTLRGERLSSVVKNLKQLSSAGFGYRELAMGMQYDTPRPEFYNTMFEKWGLKTGSQWDK